MRLLVEVAEFPNDGINPLVSHVFRSTRQSFADYVVQPFPHSSRKVLQDFLLALFNFFALAIVVDVHVFVVISAISRFTFRQLIIQKRFTMEKESYWETNR